MTFDSVRFMRDLERRYQAATGLQNRSAYKIWYCQIRPAPILTLGINPGGAPSNTSSDGRSHLTGEKAAASGSYFEGNEHDVLDCHWKENDNLRPLLTALVGGDESRIRSDVIKTNLAFQRSAKAADIDIASAIAASAPFLREIIAVVQPRLVLLTGAGMSEFTSRFTSSFEQIAGPERDPGVKQMVFAAAKATLPDTGRDALVVQVAHASQFGWTYSRYEVAARIRKLLEGLAGFEKPKAVKPVVRRRPSSSE